MMECDTFLMLGSGFPYSEFLPKEGQARGVQVDIDPGMLSIRYPMEVNLTGDVKSTLETLLHLLRAKTDGSWRESIQSWNDDWQQVLTARAHAKANPVNPRRVFTALQPPLPRSEERRVGKECGSMCRSRRPKSQ